MISKRLLTVFVFLAVAPQAALAAEVWLKQERDNSGVEYPKSDGAAPINYVNPPYADADLVLTGRPTEPIGCSLPPVSGGGDRGAQACQKANDNGYGWPQTTTTDATTKDSYNIVVNFWNNESTLADAAQYPGPSNAGYVIKNPFDRFPYTGPHRQFNIPMDFNACDGTNDATCWKVDAGTGRPRPAAPYVNGVEVLVADDAAPTFRIDKYTGNSAGAGNRDDKNAMAWIDERHFPAAYPFIYKGCHQGTCTLDSGVQGAAATQSGGPFPIQVKDLGSIPSHWKVDLSAVAGTAIYDVAYDIWFEIPNRFYWQANPWERSAACENNTNPNSCSKYWAGMPEANPVVTQPWGTELMIWINAGGFTGFNGGDASKGSITPAGSFVRTVTINGVKWDVWVGQGRDPKQSQPTPAGVADASDQWYGYWNIVSFVRQVPTDTLDIDTKLIIDEMLQNMQTDCPISYPAGVPVTGQAAACVDRSWFITEIGAGFEIWRDGAGLKTTEFNVKPTFRDGHVNDEGKTTTIPAGFNLMTDRWDDPVGGTVQPIINWQKYMQFWASGWCDGGVATYDISTADSFQATDRVNVNKWCGGKTRWSSAGRSLVDDCDTADGSAKAANRRPMVNVNGTRNQWYAIMSRGQRMWDLGMHGGATVHFYCNGTEERSINLLIDPSGAVLNVANGTPINGAFVQLLKQKPDGSFSPAVNVPPAVTFTPNVNPEVSAGAGNYAWDVAPGTYKVTAQKPGCWMPGNTSQAVVESQVLTVVNDPFYNVNLYLACPGPATSPQGGDTPGLKVTTAVTQNWTSGGNGKGGFCETVQLTNTTSAPISGWQVTFPVEKSALYTSWNATYSQPSSTQLRIKNQDNWIKTIQPGQTTSKDWLGFCVNRLP